MCGDCCSWSRNFQRTLTVQESTEILTFSTSEPKAARSVGAGPWDGRAAATNFEEQSTCSRYFKGLPAARARISSSTCAAMTCTLAAAVNFASDALASATFGASGGALISDRVGACAASIAVCWRPNFANQATRYMREIGVSPILTAWTGEAVSPAHAGPTDTRKAKASQDAFNLYPRNLSKQQPTTSTAAPS